MKKAIFLTSIILSIVHSSFAQTQKVTDGGATEYLNEVSLKYQNYSTMDVNYSFKSEKDKKVIDTHKGKMLIKGKQYYLTIPGQTFYCDGETIWNYQKESNEISIFEYDETDETIMNPAKLLADWKKNFSAKLIREEYEDGKAILIIDITPIRQQSYYRIRLFINKTKKEILRFAIYEKDNTIYTYSFDKFITNAPIDDKKFKLSTSDFPNAIVNDMR